MRQAAGALRPSQSVDEIYLLKTLEPRTARNGSLYLQLELADCSGTVQGRFWDASEALIEALRGARFIRVKGRTEVYQNRLQLVASGLRAVPTEQVNLDDFLPHTPRDVEELWGEVLRTAESIQNPHLASLLKAFVADEGFVQQFRRAPAAVSYHQPYLGGLLEHTANVTGLAEFVCARYTSLDRDLLLTGALLHDIGKIREFTYDAAFEYTDEGKLLGHLVIGVMMVQEKLNALADFPVALRDTLFHLMLSHHGEYEWGSPKLPMTPEAFALHHLDNLDAKVEASTRAIETDRLPESAWTEYNRMFGRTLYKGMSGDAGTTEQSP